MLFALVWIAVGCLIGALAAEKRGYSLPVGLIAGGLLGILSPLLLIAQPPIQKRRCPKCAENVRADAVVCRYCQSPLEAVEIRTYSAPMSAIRILAFAIAGFALLIGAIVGFGMIAKAFHI